jgi:hypothetical protein
MHDLQPFFASFRTVRRELGSTQRDDEGKTKWQLKSALKKWDEHTVHFSVFALWIADRLATAA